MKSNRTNTEANTAAARQADANAILAAVKKGGRWLARPHIFFYVLIWLMVILVWGTIAQKDMGLFRAQEKFFSSFFFEFKGIWLPGGYITMGFLTVSLMAKLVFASRWHRKALGINITHIGAALLMFGGLLTAVFSTEGSMRIDEGQKTAIVTDYYKSELVVRDITPATHNNVTTFAHGFLHAGKVMQHKDLPFSIKVIKTCENCDIARRSIVTSENVHGFLRNFELQSKPLEKEAERNRFGIQFAVTGAGKADGQYAVFEFMPVSQKIRVDGKTYEVEVRRQETRLPFSIALIDFDKKMHPGTEVAQSYSSRVALIENGTRQEYTISMNQPLRHKGYTFYQASFVEGDVTETTVLAVVKNVGRTFPYISSLVMCLGLLVHMFFMLPGLLNHPPASGRRQEGVQA